MLAALNPMPIKYLPIFFATVLKEMKKWAWVVGVMVFALKTD